MKASSKILIYDDGCPLCSAYTTAFVKAGMLDKDGRKNFNTIDTDTFAIIDKEKCNNEIPLVDIRTKQVWYGIDALLEILDTKIPGIKLLGNFKPVKWFLQKLYKLISYNRKVIVAENSSAGYDCSPDFSLRYRVLFMAVFFLFNTIMLVPLYQTIFRNCFTGNSSLFQLQAAHFCLVATNLSCAVLLKQREAIEYLGQVNMLAFTTILLMLPLHITNYYLFVNATLNNIYLALLSLIIIKAYIKRMKYAGIIGDRGGVVIANIISLAVFITYLII